MLSVTHNTGCPTVFTDMRLNAQRGNVSYVECDRAESDPRPLFVLWAQSRDLRPCWGVLGPYRALGHRSPDTLHASPPHCSSVFPGCLADSGTRSMLSSALIRNRGPSPGDPVLTDSPASATRWPWARLSLLRTSIFQWVKPRRRAFDRD